MRTIILLFFFLWRKNNGIGAFLEVWADFAIEFDAALQQDINQDFAIMIVQTPI